MCGNVSLALARRSFVRPSWGRLQGLGNVAAPDHPDLFGFKVLPKPIKLTVAGDTAITHGQFGNMTYATAEDLAHTILQTDFTIKGYTCIPSHGIKEMVAKLNNILDWGVCQRDGNPSHGNSVLTF